VEQPGGIICAKGEKTLAFGGAIESMKASIEKKED